MYKIRQHGFMNDQPWDLTLSERVKRIFEAKSKGLKMVVYLYEMPDTSTFRYRVYNMCQILELSLNWRGTYFYKNELRVIYKYICHIDLAAVVRFKWNSEIADVIDFAHKNGVPVAFDTDDLVYDTKYIPMIMNALSVNEDEERLDYWFSYVSRVAQIVSKCDYMVTTNQYLADLMKADLKKEVFVVPNCLNRAQLEVSQDYYLQKRQQCSSGRFVVGYFSGTPSHINDFRTAAPELARVLEECPDMVLRIVGFMELPQYMQGLKEKGRIERGPLVTFTQLQKELAKADVNIAPLTDNLFTNCKSELKYFEAAAVGTVTCASPTYVFKETIVDGMDGYLCKPGQWYEILKCLYETRKLGFGAVCENAYRKGIEKYAYYNLTADLDKVLEHMAGGK